MIIPHLPDNSRVWFFGANMLLDSQQTETLCQRLDLFVSDWKAHGAELRAGYTLLHDSILIVAVDQSVAAPTGCSIDKVFKLLNDFPVDFFQRLTVWQPFCNTAKIFSINAAQVAFMSKEIDVHTLVINPLIQTLGEARERLYIPLSESWAYAKISQ
jgi:hypothetical protein